MKTPIIPPGLEPGTARSPAPAEAKPLATPPVKVEDRRVKPTGPVPQDQPAGEPERETSFETPPLPRPAALQPPNK